MAAGKRKPEPAVPPPVETAPDVGEFLEQNDAGISLDKLSEAFAEMLGTGDDPFAEAPAAPPADDAAALLAAELPEDPAIVDRDAACEISPTTILEAMLFVGDPENAPITSEWLASQMRGVRRAEIDAAIGELNARYAAEHRPYEIASAGAGYRLVLRGEFRALRDKCLGRHRGVRLSQAAVEVLSVVAYHGSLTADEVGKLRNKPSGAILTQLVRRQLLRVDRPEGTSRRSAKFVPTRRFLDLFGLAGLEDLPRVRDVERR